MNQPLIKLPSSTSTQSCSHRARLYLFLEILSSIVLLTYFWTLPLALVRDRDYCRVWCYFQHFYRCAESLSIQGSAQNMYCYLLSLFKCINPLYDRQSKYKDICDDHQARPCFFMTSSMCLPIRDGDLDTTMPAYSKALILLAASPLPFCTMAPAWPILRSGGAVRPAMKPTTGFLAVLFFLSQSAAISSASPPISPIMTMPWVSGSTTNLSRTSMKLVPLKGSPPIPTTVDWPRPALVVWSTASQVRVPDLLTMPILPVLWMQPGMIPILHSSGLMMPGQLGPITRVIFWDRRACLTLIISCWGIPSVMTTANPISASMASRMASAAVGGGTQITVASHPVTFLAYLQSLKTGRPRWVEPAFLGDTPPTILVPQSRACWVWKVPWLPVIPWQITLVSLFTQTLAVELNRFWIVLVSIAFKIFYQILQNYSQMQSQHYFLFIQGQSVYPQILKSTLSQTHSALFSLFSVSLGL